MMKVFNRLFRKDDLRHTKKALVLLADESKSLLVAYLDKWLGEGISDLSLYNTGYALAGKVKRIIATDKRLEDFYYSTLLASA